MRACILMQVSWLLVANLVVNIEALRLPTIKESSETHEETCKFSLGNPEDSDRIAQGEWQPLSEESWEVMLAEAKHRSETNESLSVAESIAGYDCKDYTAAEMNSHQTTWFCSRKSKFHDGFAGEFELSEDLKTPKTAEYMSRLPGEDDRVVKSLRWQWRPKGCGLVAATKENLRTSLANRRVVMVGDSLQEEQFFSLACKLQAPMTIEELPKIEELNNNIFGTQWPMEVPEAFFRKATVGNGMVAVHRNPHMFDDYATSGIEDAFERGMKQTLQLFGEGGSRASDVLVINTGAHLGSGRKTGYYQGYDTRQKSETLEERMSSWANFLADNFKGAVLFATNVPGHDECTKASAPGFHKSTKFNWATFHKINRRIISAFQQNDRLRNRFAVLNRSMLDTRADGHHQWHSWDGQGFDEFADCLHYCLPGPIDISTDLLQHYLFMNPA